MIHVPTLDTKMLIHGPLARLCEKWELISIAEHFANISSKVLPAGKARSQHKARHISETVATCAAGRSLCGTKAATGRAAHVETAPLAGHAAPKAWNLRGRGKHVESSSHVSGPAEGAG